MTFGHYSVLSYFRRHFHMNTTSRDTVLHFLKNILLNMPEEWLTLTTHRLDIYDESQAKKQFVDQLNALFVTNNTTTIALQKLPTAYDYIRLGHPLSCVLEWVIAALQATEPRRVIVFSSQTIPLLAILRKNFLENKPTQIICTHELPEAFDAEIVRRVYGYQFEVKTNVSATNLKNKKDNLEPFKGSTVVISPQKTFVQLETLNYVDFYINTYSELGSILLINSEQQDDYIGHIQHMRRRETIAMTPANCLIALHLILGDDSSYQDSLNNIPTDMYKTNVQGLISKITGTRTMPLIGSSGLSVQYAIMMGLTDYATENYIGKAIKFIVPTNCYGGTNDQARRVAECVPNVEIIDLAVDGQSDMVNSLNAILHKVAEQDAIAYVIAEIPTNPRLEVPNLERLRDILAMKRKTISGKTAIEPVFILDQTFCPNVQFLNNDTILSSVRALSYASGSKFPSGGKCTAGYCVTNNNAAELTPKIALHLTLCDNEATALQYKILANQLTSMNQRIANAYKNTVEFINFIKEILPSATINFVSTDLAKQGFTPSVFSLDLPTKGSNNDEKEIYKRVLNNKLIQMMISQIPQESKNCVSYGQLKGCYWTIPATSTQGTTKEGDKDYIVRVAMSPSVNMQKHKEVFAAFVNEIEI